MQPKLAKIHHASKFCTSVVLHKHIMLMLSLRWCPTNTAVIHTLNACNHGWVANAANYDSPWCFQMWSPQWWSHQYLNDGPWYAHHLISLLKDSCSLNAMCTQIFDQTGPQTSQRELFWSGSQMISFPLYPLSCYLWKHYHFFHHTAAFVFKTTYTHINYSSVKTNFIIQAWGIDKNTDHELVMHKNKVYEVK